MATLEAYLELERRWSEWLSDTTPHCVACSSGTAALHLGLEALNLLPNRLVVVPEFTMIACARAVSLAGHKPVFVDCDRDLCLNTDLLETIPPETKAVMAVHIYGRRCDMQSIHSNVSCAVMEDMAELHGIRPHRNTDVACWSFYKNKAIAGEEGGMVAFKCKEHAERARSLRSLGFTENHDFLHIPRGHNYRMSNVHAELVLDSLDRFPQNSVRRRLVEGWYDQRVPGEWKLPVRDAVWVYDLLLPEGTDTAYIVKELNRCGVAARLAFRPMSEQPEYRNYAGEPKFKQTVAYEMSRRVIYLPVHPDMTVDDVERITGQLKLIVAKL